MAMTVNIHEANTNDRILAAQAITEGLTLVTADRAFDAAPGLSLLRW